MLLHASEPAVPSMADPKRSNSFPLFASRDVSLPPAGTWKQEKAQEEEDAPGDRSRCSASGLKTETSPAMLCDMQVRLEARMTANKPWSFYRPFKPVAASAGPHNPA